MRCPLSILFLLTTLPAYASVDDPRYELGFALADGDLEHRRVTCTLSFPSGTAALAGWSLSICHDVPILEAIDAKSGATTLTILDGQPPEFESITITGNDNAVPPYTPGATQGVLISFSSSEELPPGDDYELFDIDYHIQSAGELHYCESVFGGAHAVETLLAPVGGVISIRPATSTILVETQPFRRFRRGDANGDGDVNLHDAIFVLAALFVPGAPSAPCADAADIDDDERIGIGDPIALLRALFVPDSGVILDSSCAIDGRAGSLGCESYDSCPWP